MHRTTSSREPAWLRETQSDKCCEAIAAQALVNRGNEQVMLYGFQFKLNNFRAQQQKSG